MKKTISFNTFEFVPHPQNISLYNTLVVIFLLISLWRALVKDYTGFLLAGAVGITLFIFAHTKPKGFKVEITEEGITIGNKKYPYKDLKGFSFFEETPYETELLIKTKYLLNHYLIIPIPPKKKKEIENLLSKFIPLKDYHYPLLERIHKFF